MIRAFLLGCAVGYLLARRRRIPGWQPADVEYRAGDAWWTADPPTYASVVPWWVYYS